LTIRVSCCFLCGSLWRRLLANFFGFLHHNFVDSSDVFRLQPMDVFFLGSKTDVKDQLWAYAEVVPER
jgi:hypothetical protein